VVRFSSIRALLAFGVSRQMLIHQMDVVTAFLNGTLDEEIIIIIIIKPSLYTVTNQPYYLSVFTKIIKVVLH
jgi:hypothetical protein